MSLISLEKFVWKRVVVRQVMCGLWKKLPDQLAALVLRLHFLERLALPEFYGILADSKTIASRHDPIG